MERIRIVLFLSTAILVMGSVGGSYFAVLQSTSAQMMAGPNMTDRNMTEMMKPGMMPLIRGENVTGSINLMSTISNAIASQVKVSLSEAATSAENNVGNGSHAVAAHIGGENGYIVYTVCVFDPNGKLHKIIIDPADGKILLTRELSGRELMIINQGMMMGRGMMDNGMMMGRGMMDNGMMMGRGMMDNGMMMEGWESQ
jgi:uncharacterized membrane protein YkoI